MNTKIMCTVLSLDRLCLKFNCFSAGLAPLWQSPLIGRKEKTKSKKKKKSNNNRKGEEEENMETKYEFGLRATVSFLLITSFSFIFFGRSLHCRTQSNLLLFTLFKWCRSTKLISIFFWRLASSYAVLMLSTWCALSASGDFCLFYFKKGKRLVRKTTWPSVSFSYFRPHPPGPHMCVAATWHNALKTLKSWVLISRSNLKL